MTRTLPIRPLVAALLSLGVMAIPAVVDAGRSPAGANPYCGIVPSPENLEVSPDDLQSDAVTFTFLLGGWNVTPDVSDLYYKIDSAATWTSIGDLVGSTVTLTGGDLVEAFVATNGSEPAPGGSSQFKLKLVTNGADVENTSTFCEGTITISWAEPAPTTTVPDDGGSLPPTGTSSPGTLPIAVALLLGGGLVLVVNRRRATHR